jgi:hypothetical protein
LQGVGVDGDVTFKGEPIADGSINFIPIDGTAGPTAGASITDGRFSIPRRGGLVPGRYRVEISSFRETTKATSAGAQMFGRPVESFAGGNATQAQRTIRENVIPKKYNANSELTETIPDQSSHTVSYNL